MFAIGLAFCILALILSGSVLYEEKRMRLKDIELSLCLNSPVDVGVNEIYCRTKL